MALDKLVIGDRLRKIRETLGETREEFAQSCNLTSRHVAKLERGECFMNLITLDSIASVACVQTDFILYGEQEKDKKTIIERKILNFMSNSTEEELMILNEWCKLLRKYVNVKYVRNK